MGEYIAVERRMPTVERDLDDRPKFMHKQTDRFFSRRVARQRGEIGANLYVVAGTFVGDPTSARAV